MEKLIYNIFNKIFMNEVENELLEYIGAEKDKIIFDVGCYRGNFTKNIIKLESKKNIQSNFFLFVVKKPPSPQAFKFFKGCVEKQPISPIEPAGLL